MKIQEVTPDRLRKISDEELLNLHRRCHQLYPQVKEHGGQNINLEDIINAHHLIVVEMERRGMKHNIRDELDRELKKKKDQNRESESAQMTEKSGLWFDIDKLPEKAILIPDFVCLTGSAVRRKDFDDLDILIRSDIEKGKFSLNFENVYVLLRLLLDPEKKHADKLHLIANSQGVFTNHIPLYDLALVRSENRGLKEVNPFIKAKETFSALTEKARNFIGSIGKRSKWEPISRDFKPAKPGMANYWPGTEAFEPEDLVNWLKDHPHCVAENKLNGVRGFLQKKGNEVSIYFEDSKQERADKLKDLADRVRKIPADFILDVDFGVVQGGKRWPRVKLMTLLGKEPKLPANADLVVTAFDIVYWDEAGGDIHEKPFKERRKLLEKFYDKYLKKDKKHFDISRAREVRNLDDLKKAWKELGWYQMAEGIMVKDVEAPYPEGPSQNWAKIKHVAELKALVYDVKRNKNGTYSFWCALAPGNLEFENTIEIDGKVYVDMKKTMNASFKASKGDIVTVQPQEIILTDGKEGDVISWTAAVPVDVDKTRKTPYTAGQAIDLADRAGILNDARAKTWGATEEEEEVVEKLLDADWDYDESKLEFLSSYEPRSKEAAIYKKIYSRLAKSDPANIRQTVMKAYALEGPKGVLALAKELKDEGETRGERAAKYWAEHWHENLPKSGKGEFIVQHHWRGLSEEEAKNLSHEELLRTGRSVHADLRLSANDHLWGFTIFLGENAENLKAGGSLLNKLSDPNRKLEGAWKLPQPKEWLNVAVKKPFVVPPRGAGATEKKWGKFFLYDKGTYELGVCRQHFFEVFLHGKRMKGRYIIQYAHLEGREGRVWLIDKPSDETPYADKHKLEDIVKELRKKGQKYLVWAKPGEKPKFIDVEKFKLPEERKVEKSKDERVFHAEIVKVDKDKRFALAPALIPDKPDSDGEFVTAEEIERAAHDFMAWYQMITYMHAVPLERRDVAIVESYILRESTRIGGRKLPAGTWMLGLKIFDDKLWDKVKKGELKGISIGGYCMGAKSLEKSAKRATPILHEDDDDDEPKELKGLRVFEVALVDNPAVPDAHWLILKRQKERGENVPEEKESKPARDQKPAQDVLKMLAEIERLLGQVIAKVESMIVGYGYPAPEKEAPKAQKAEEKGQGKAEQSDAVKAAIQALRALLQEKELSEDIKKAIEKLIEKLERGDGYPAPQGYPAPSTQRKNLGLVVKSYDAAIKALRELLEKEKLDAATKNMIRSLINALEAQSKQQDEEETKKADKSVDAAIKVLNQLLEKEDIDAETKKMIRELIRALQAKEGETSEEVKKQLKEVSKSFEKKIGALEEHLSQIENKFMASGKSQQLRGDETQKEDDNFYAKLGRDSFGRRIKNRRK